MNTAPSVLDCGNGHIKRVQQTELQREPAGRLSFAARLIRSKFKFR
jgi:hypothetical protein